MLKKHLATLLIIGIIIPLALMSCGEKEPPPPVFTKGSLDATAYNDAVYYYKPNEGPRYQIITDLHEGGTPIYGDAFTSEDDPFAHISAGLEMILVDPYMTAKNGGAPVLIMTYEDSVLKKGDWKDVYKVVSFNTANNKLKVICEFEDINAIMSVATYGDTVFFVTHEGEAGMNLHAISTDGKNHRVLDNPDGSSFRLTAVYNDVVYLVDQYNGGMYTCDMDFGNMQKFLDIQVKPLNSFLHDGYIYYYNSYERKTIDGSDYGFDVYDVARRSLNDLDKEETVLQCVTSCYVIGGTIYYWSADDVVIGRNGIENTYKVVRSYDPENGETKLIHDTNDPDVSGVLIGSAGKYLVFRNSDWTSGKGYGDLILVCLDTETGEIITIDKLST